MIVHYYSSMLMLHLLMMVVYRIDNPYMHMVGVSKKKRRKTKKTKRRLKTTMKRMRKMTNQCWTSNRKMRMKKRKRSWYV